MDVKIKNSWVNDENTEESDQNELEDNNSIPIVEDKSIIDKKTFNNLMEVPNNPIDEFNFDNFMKQIHVQKEKNIEERKVIRKERKRLFDFNKGYKINYYYVLPLVGIGAFLLLK